MKVLLLFPRFYSLDRSFKKGFELNGHEVLTFDYRQSLTKLAEKINSRKVKLSHSLRKRWENYYFEKINFKHKEIFNDYDPDVVLIYNNEMLLPGTMKEFRKRARIIFFLGDSPFYTPTSNYNLSLLYHSEHIFCPDSGWIEQLRMLGLDNLHFLAAASDPELNFKTDVSDEHKRNFGSDLVFIGGNYDHSWGFKRCLFLNEFADMDFRFYGPASWEKWFSEFPRLKRCFVPHQQGRIGFQQLNTILNCSKIYPVDANPGLINGVHIRIFECIRSGILPIAEYRKDIERVFSGAEIPVIHNYSEAAKIAEKYLEDDTLRNNTINDLMEYVRKNYSPERTVGEILAYL